MRKNSYFNDIDKSKEEYNIQKSDAINIYNNSKSDYSTKLDSSFKKLHLPTIKKNSLPPIPVSSITKRIKKSQSQSNLIEHNKKINIYNQNNEKEKNKKEIIEEDIDTKNIPIYIEEKEKRLLNNLIQQINDIENYREKDCEFHKEFKLPEVPDYDTMYDSDNEKDNINNKNKNVKENMGNEQMRQYITWAQKCITDVIISN